MSVSSEPFSSAASTDHRLFEPTPAEEAATAYRLQILGAREGAVKGTLISATLVTLGNWRFPLVARQTLAGKAFLISCVSKPPPLPFHTILRSDELNRCYGRWGTIAGLVIGAESYLIPFEREQRERSERWRTVARNELAATGTVPSESRMQQWKRDKDSEYAASLVAAKNDAEPTI